MLLERAVIPFTTDSWDVYKTLKNGTLFFYIFNMEGEIVEEINRDQPFENWEKSYEELETNLSEFYEENKANCHHYIGEFLIETVNHPLIVGEFKGFEYYSIFEISYFLHKLIKYMQKVTEKKLEMTQIKVATLYDLASLEDLKPNTYQEHNFLNQKIIID